MTALQPAPRLVLVAILTLAFSSILSAQNQVTAADIQRLQDAIYDTSRDVTQVRGRDATLASQLESQLDELRDEVVYLRVKLRKNETVARSEYSDLRDRIDALRSRARGDSTPRPSPASSKAPTAETTVSRASNFDVPPGTEVDVRLQQALTSKTAKPEDRFEATTLVDLSKEGRVLIPAGSVMRGTVQAVNRPGRIDRKGSLDLVFDQLTIRGRTHVLRGTLTKAIESEGIRGDAEKIGVGAGIGAILGGIIGGFRGVLAGIVIGGGGVIAATEGEDVELPVGTVLRVRLDTGLDLP